LRGGEAEKGRSGEGEKGRLEAAGVGFAFHGVELTQVGEVARLRGWEVEKLRNQKQKAPALLPGSPAHLFSSSHLLNLSAHRPRRLVFRRQRLHGLHDGGAVAALGGGDHAVYFFIQPQAARRIGGAVAGHEDLLVRGAHVGLAEDEQSLSISIRLSVSIRCTCLTLTLPSSNS